MNPDRHKIKLIAVLIGMAFLIMAVRLWQLQALHGKQLRRASEDNRLRITDLYAPRGIIYDRNGVPLVRNSPNFCVSVLPELLDQSRVGEIAALLGVELEEIARRLRLEKGSIEPIVLKQGLSFQEIARLEARLSDFPELVVNVDIARHYIYGEMAAHLIGYIGKLTKAQSKDPAYANVPHGGFAGQSGIEKLFDGKLRGVAGQRVIEVDALGRELKILGEVPPKKGDDITLSLDKGLQAVAEEAYGQRPGAMVALNPNTGEVLVFVSKPAFDPNLFVMGIDPQEWKRLSGGENFPLLNRAIQSQYPPGSTFKIITAIAALESGVMKPDDGIVCRGGFPFGGRVFGCWRREGHGRMDVHKAIVQSCDVYFYNAGLRAGVDRIAEYSRAFGLGMPVGLGLGSEKNGLVPDTLWKQTVKKEKWYTGETVSVAIGQGYMLVTPFQMARLMAAVGTGGHLLPEPRLVKSDAPAKGKAVSPPVAEDTIERVRASLVGVLSEQGGTARGSASQLVTIAGKTGTAQVISSIKGPDHAWFVAYAPSEAPEIALAVLVEKGGHGSSAAAPIAKKTIEAYIKNKGHRESADAAGQKSNTEL